MPDLTLVQRFGTNIAFNESTKVLSINLEDLASVMIGGVDVGLNTTAMTSANKDEYAAKILWALLLQRLSNE